MPCPSSASAASIARCTPTPTLTMVRSSPSRRLAARPMATACHAGGATPRAPAASKVHHLPATAAQGVEPVVSQQLVLQVDHRPGMLQGRQHQAASGRAGTWGRLRRGRVPSLAGPHARRQAHRFRRRRLLPPCPGPLRARSERHNRKRRGQSVRLFPSAAAQSVSCVHIGCEQVTGAASPYYTTLSWPLQSLFAIYNLPRPHCH